MSTADPTEMLRRILGEEGDALMHMMHSESSDKALLHSAGVISRRWLRAPRCRLIAQRNPSQLGINPPVPLEELSKKPSTRLMYPHSKKYLAASDVDVDRLAARGSRTHQSNSAAATKNPEAKPKAKALEKILGFLRRPQAVRRWASR